MNPTSKYNLVNDVLTHIAFGIWALLALWFFQERLYSDSGFFISKVVHYECFWMELNRFMRVFSQWLPLICIKLGCGLKTVLLAYSLGHVLFFYGMFLIGRYRWGNRQIGWLLVGTQTIGILHGFCSPGYELYYATAFLALFAIILNTNDFTRRNTVYLVLLVITMVINYQLIIFMIGGVLLLHFAAHKFQYWKQYALIMGAIVACFGLKQLLTAHSYEIAKMEQFILNLTERSYTWDGYIKPLFSFYGAYYKELGFIAILTLCLYLKEKRYYTALGYVLFLVLTQYIIALTYPDIRHSRYQEQCYYPLIFVVCFPLIMELKNRLTLQWKWVYTVGLFGLIVYRFVAISFAIEPFTHRVNYMHRIIEAGQYMEGNKFIMREAQWNPTFGGTSFTLGMESMLLSGLNPARKTIHIIRDTEWLAQDSGNVKTLQDPNLYMFTYRSFYDRTDSIYHHNDANPKYFNFPPGKYRYLNGRAANLEHIEDLKKALLIKTYQKGPYKANSTANILIKLTNRSRKPLNSEQLRIAYHWWKDGEIVHWEGYRSPLELDLPPQKEYYQYIMVLMPKEPGQYELQVDPIAEGTLGWMHLPQRVPVLIQ